MEIIEMIMNENNKNLYDLRRNTISKLFRKIHDDKKTQAIVSLQARGFPYNDNKVENIVKSWYWSVGFNGCEIVNDKDIIIYVNRPNKFIGKFNYLVYLNSVLNNLGFNIIIQKRHNEDIYNAFFNEVAVS